MQLIEFTNKGLYCTQGDFYIDPWKPVQRAVITHAHSDHARLGNNQYLCHHLTVPLLEARLGHNDYQGIEWNESLYINGVRLSLHPAGHIIGSSQVRLEYNNEVWVVSGDYKTEDDSLSGAFEIVPCNVFITESTFGLPIYNWQPQSLVYENICNWIRTNNNAGKTSLLIAYSLGKAQRLLKATEHLGDKVYVHGAIWNMHQALIAGGVKLPPVERITTETSKDVLKQCIVIAPPGADQSPWARRLEPYAIGVCSGWMQVRGNVRRRNADAGFVLSDHADWKGLLATVKATGAEKVFVTHGFQSVFSRYLNENGIISAEVKTEYNNDDEEPVNDAGVVENTSSGVEQNLSEYS